MRPCRSATPSSRSATGEGYIDWLGQGGAIEPPCPGGATFRRRQPRSANAVGNHPCPEKTRRSRPRAKRRTFTDPTAPTTTQCRSPIGAARRRSDETIPAPVDPARSSRSAAEGPADGGPVDNVLGDSGLRPGGPDRPGRRTPGRRLLGGRASVSVGSVLVSQLGAPLGSSARIVWGSWAVPPCTTASRRRSSRGSRSGSPSTIRKSA